MRAMSDRAQFPAACARVALALLCGACASSSSATPAREASPPPAWGLVVHGGAGAIPSELRTPEIQASYRAALAGALRAGHGVLARGGTSLDAVTAAITRLEDDPLFNAGK